MKTYITAAYAVFFVLAFTPMVASAKIGKAQQAEFAGNVEKFATVTETEGRQAWLVMTSITLPKKDALKQLEPILKSEDNDERFALGLALTNLGDKRGPAMVVDAFGKLKKPYSALRRVFATVPMKTQSKLIDALLKSKKLDERQELYRYILTCLLYTSPSPRD